MNRRPVAAGGRRRKRTSARIWFRSNKGEIRKRRWGKVREGRPEGRRAGRGDQGEERNGIASVTGKFSD